MNSRRHNRISKAIANRKPLTIEQEKPILSEVIDAPSDEAEPNRLDKIIAYTVISVAALIVMWPWTIYTIYFFSRSEPITADSLATYILTMIVTLFFALCFGGSSNKT